MDTGEDRIGEGEAGPRERCATNLARGSDGTGAALRAARRGALVAARQAMPADARAAAQERMGKRLEAVLRLLARATRPDGAGTRGRPVVGVYLPFRGEPDLSACLDRLRRRGWTMALPRVTDQDAPLVFGRWDAEGALRPDRYGIRVPEPFEPMSPTLLVLPCVGFHRDGWRLGYGGGFYDRTLASPAFADVPAVGVAFDEAEVTDFVPGPHDRPLAAVVTPGGVHGIGACRPRRRMPPG